MDRNDITGFPSRRSRASGRDGRFLPTVEAASETSPTAAPSKSLSPRRSLERQSDQGSHDDNSWLMAESTSRHLPSTVNPINVRSGEQLNCGFASPSETQPTTPPSTGDASLAEVASEHPSPSETAAADPDAMAVRRSSANARSAGFSNDIRHVDLLRHASSPDTFRGRLPETGYTFKRYSYAPISPRGYLERPSSPVKMSIHGTMSGNAENPAAESEKLTNAVLAVQACLSCRRLKIRCSGSTHAKGSTCSQCESRRTKCEWSEAGHKSSLRFSPGMGVSPVSSVGITGNVTKPTTPSVTKDDSHATVRSSSEETLGRDDRRREIINNVMRFFVRWLDSRLGVARHQMGSSEVGRELKAKTVALRLERDHSLDTATWIKKPSTPASTLPPAFESSIFNQPGVQCSLFDQETMPPTEMPHRSSSGGPSRPLSGSRGLKKGARRPLAPKRKGDQSDEDDETSRSPKKTRENAEDAEKLKFACPYFKHNPRKYKHQRPCCGPGWDFVHRIKEHLYRKHALPRFTCHRCCQPFDAEEDLQAHARDPEPCQVRDPEPLDGFNQDQEKRLRSRKRTAGEELTEPEKWKQMYRILFPDVAEDEIPSPYYDEKDVKTGNLQGYEDYLRRELPPIVRRRLEQEVERELNFVEEGLKRRVIDIVRNLQLTLFRSYQQLEDVNAKAEQAPTPSPADAPPFPEATISPVTNTPGTSVGVAQSESATDVSVDFSDVSSFAYLPDPLGILDSSTYSLFGSDFDFGQFMDGVGAASSMDDSTNFSESGYSAIASQEAVGIAQDSLHLMN